MQNRASPLSPDVWLNNLFTSKAAQRGEVIRRAKRDVERFAGMQRFFSEIDRRGFQVAENAGQFIIFCNREPVRILTTENVKSSKDFTPKSFKDFDLNSVPIGRR